MNNDLIYGSKGKNNIVSLEDNSDGTVDLFLQQPDGSIAIETVNNEYWILTDEPADKMSIELDGNGYYKYKNVFSLADDFEFARKAMWRHKHKAFWINDYKEAFMCSQGYGYYQGLKHSEVSVLAFDIETNGIKLDKDSKVLLISNTYRDSKGNIERKLFAYDDYSSDKEFLEAWCAWVRKVDPSIIVGHNIYSFDLKFLDHIAGLNDCELMLGRKEKALRFNKWESKFRKDQSQFYSYKKCYIHGREIVDTFFLSIKYDISRKYNSYKLKEIIAHEGLERKGRTFYDASLIRKNYLIPDEWLKIKRYAEDDSDDALSLWDLMGPSFFYMCQSIPKSFQEIIAGATGSALNSMMIRGYLQENCSLPQTSKVGAYVGGISKGVPGIYKHCIRWDLISMYPSIMRQYKVYDKKKDPKSYFLNITEFFSLERLKNKKLAKETQEKYYDDLQASQKILANSLYGTCATNGLLFNYPEGAEFITKKGREILISAIKWASGVDYV